MQFLFVPIEFEIRALDAGEDIPVDVADVVAGGIVAEVVELGAGPPLAREMFAATAIGQPAGRQQPHPLDPRKGAVVEQRRETGGGHAMADGEETLANDILRAQEFDRVQILSRRRVIRQPSILTISNRTRR